MTAQFPNYVTLLLDDAGEEFDPEVISTPMERGMPKQRQGNSRVTVKVSAKLLFRSRQATLDFDAWYFNDIQRIGFFDVFDSRSGTTIAMRFEGGKIGKLVPYAARYRSAYRTVTLEYLR